MPRITFKKNRVMTEDHVVDVEEGDTVLEAAEKAGIPVGSNCGGVCGCSTCHVYVIKGFDSLDEMDDPEADRLDLAFDVKLNSRLGCQAAIAEEDLIVDISDESLKAFFDENPAIREEFEKTGVFPYVPRHGHHH